MFGSGIVFLIVMLEIIVLVCTHGNNEQSKLANVTAEERERIHLHSTHRENNVAGLDINGDFSDITGSKKYNAKISDPLCTESYLTGSDKIPNTMTDKKLMKLDLGMTARQVVAASGIKNWQALTFYGGFHSYDTDYDADSLLELINGNVAAGSVEFSKPEIAKINSVKLQNGTVWLATGKLTHDSQVSYFLVFGPNLNRLVSMIRINLVGKNLSQVKSLAVCKVSNQEMRDS